MKEPSQSEDNNAGETSNVYSTLGEKSQENIYFIYSSGPAYGSCGTSGKNRETNKRSALGPNNVHEAVLAAQIEDSAVQPEPTIFYWIK